MHTSLASQISKNLTESTHLSQRKHNIAQHFANAQDYHQHASVQQHICQHLIAQVQQPTQHSVLEIGAGQGQLTKLLANAITTKHWHINELCQSQQNKLQEILPTAKLYIGDAERMDLGSEHSLIVSANAVQWFDQPLQFIEQSAKRLQAGGQLLFNTFTERNFYQIKQLTGQGLTYPSLHDWQQALIQNQLKIIELSPKKYHLTFDTPYEVLKHIKKTGVSTVNTTANTDNSGDKHLDKYCIDTQPSFRWTKSTLAKFEKDYRQFFTNQQGQLVLTYEALIINAHKVG